MQLNLAFLELELLPPPTHMASEHVEATTEARDAAVEILARILAQTAKIEEQTVEASDE
jgi:hypothetical protein